MLEEEMFPCWRGKHFPFGWGNVSLLEGETLPCWREKRFPVGEGNISLLERETFPCWRGKHFPGGGGNISLLEGEAEPFPWYLLEGEIFVYWTVKPFLVGLLEGEKFPC